MMTREDETYDLMVCIECGFYIANGEEGADPDPSWSAEACDAACNKYSQVVNGDSERDTDFSRQPCELCGSKLGGARMHCVAWNDHRAA